MTNDMLRQIFSIVDAQDLADDVLVSMGGVSKPL
ncbi:MAG: hypothetical protein RLZZ282_1241 [Verrucomicrobiota bacterium]|jgi:hypothetical protein